MKPSFPFYPDDWLNDLALRGCSPLSRAIWMDLICLMHQGIPYGHLADKAGPLAMRFVASRCGVSLKQLMLAIEDLEKRDVFSRTDEKTIYSRRMVRDEYKRIVRGSGGRESLNNPSVPQPKKDTLQGYLPRSTIVPSFDPVKDKEKSFREVVFDPVPGWNAFKLAYPCHRLNEYMDIGVWIGVVDSKETQMLIMQRLAEYKQSSPWQEPQMIPKASKWLGEREFNVPPCPPARKSNGKEALRVIPERPKEPTKDEKIEAWKYMAEYDSDPKAREYARQQLEAS